MTGDSLPSSEILGITSKDAAAMKRLRRRETFCRIGWGFLSTFAGILAGFLPVLAIAVEANSRASDSYPYVIGTVACVAKQKDAGRKPRVLRFFSIPLLLVGIVIGLLVGMTGSMTVTMYGVYGHR